MGWQDKPYEEQPWYIKIWAWIVLIYYFSKGTVTQQPEKDGK
jgi:hypothetical protein